jgi:hypothetical protein
MIKENGALYKDSLNINRGKLYPTFTSKGFPLAINVLSPKRGTSCTFYIHNTILDDNQ